MPNTLIIAELEKEDVKPSTLTRTEKTKLIDFVAEEDYIRDKSGKLVKKSEKDQNGNTIPREEEPVTDVGSLLDSADLSVLDGAAVDSQGNPINNTGGAGTTTTGGTATTVPDQNSSTSTTTNTEPAKQDAKNKSTDSPDGAPATVTTDPATAVATSKNVDPTPTVQEINSDGNIVTFKGPNGQGGTATYKIVFLDKFHVGVDESNLKNEPSKTNSGRYVAQVHSGGKSNPPSAYGVYGKGAPDEYNQKIPPRWIDIVNKRGFKSMINMQTFEPSGLWGRAQGTGLLYVNGKQVGTGEPGEFGVNSDKQKDYGLYAVEYKSGNCDVIGHKKLLQDAAAGLIKNAIRSITSSTVNNGKLVGYEESAVINGTRTGYDGTSFSRNTYFGKCKYKGKWQFFAAIAMGNSWTSAGSVALNTFFKSQKDSVLYNCMLGDGSASANMFVNNDFIAGGSRGIPSIIYW